MNFGIIFYLFFLMTNSHSFELTEAMKLMQVSCDSNGQPKACFNLANMLILAKEEKMAQHYFDLACKREYQPACEKKLWVIPKKEKKVKDKARFFTRECASLLDFLADCKDFKCAQSNPLSPEEKINHQVIGKGFEGFCKYQYDLSPGYKMVCFMDLKTAKSFRDRSETESLEILSRLKKNGICNERQIKL